MTGDGYVLCIMLHASLIAALRHDDEFGYVAAWEFGEVPTLHTEDLTFEYVHPSTRSYK